MEHIPDEHRQIAASRQVGGPQALRNLGLVNHQVAVRLWVSIIRATPMVTVVGIIPVSFARGCIARPARNTGMRRRIVRSTRHVIIAAHGGIGRGIAGLENTGHAHGPWSNSLVTSMSM